MKLADYESGDMAKERWIDNKCEEAVEAGIELAKKRHEAVKAK